MDKDVFDSVCNRYEARIDRLEESLDRTQGLLYENAKAEVCVKHGGHKFDSKLISSCTNVCEYCDFVEVRKL